jgi:hypothetical protein
MFKQEKFNTYKYYHPGVNIRRSEQPRIPLSKLQDYIKYRSWKISGLPVRDSPDPYYLIKSEEETRKILENAPAVLCRNKYTKFFEPIPDINSVYPVIRLFSSELTRHFVFEKVQFSGTIQYKKKPLFVDEKDLPVIEGCQDWEPVFQFFVRFPFSLPVARTLYEPDYPDRDLIFHLYEREYRFDTYLGTGVRKFLPGDYSIRPDIFRTTYRRPSASGFDLLPQIQLNSDRTEVEFRYTTIPLPGVVDRTGLIFALWRTVFDKFKALPAEQRKNRFPKDLSVPRVALVNEDNFVYGIDSDEFYWNFVAPVPQDTYEYIDLTLSSSTEVCWESDCESDLTDSVIEN